MKRNCSRCRVRPRRAGGRYCADCHAASMRAYRKRIAADIRELLALTKLLRITKIANEIAGARA